MLLHKFDQLNAVGDSLQDVDSAFNNLDGVYVGGGDPARRGQVKVLDLFDRVIDVIDS